MDRLKKLILIPAIIITMHSISTTQAIINLTAGVTVTLIQAATREQHQGRILIQLTAIIESKLPSLIPFLLLKPKILNLQAKI